MHEFTRAENSDEWKATRRIDETCHFLATDSAEPLGYIEKYIEYRMKMTEAEKLEDELEVIIEKGYASLPRSSYLG
jgi:hypothetical protein